MTQPPRIVLTPFFRPRDEGTEEQQIYVAGFVDEENEVWGALIPLEAEMVEQAVIRHQAFRVWCNSDGRIQPQPGSDGLFEHLLENGQLKETPVDQLVVEAIEDGKNEPNDEILDMFETLHERLVRATSAVADEIARRKR
jgi:aminopeptidase-like protein